MDSLRLSIAETLESLGLCAMDAQDDERAMRLWHGADTLRWCEAREQVDEQLDIEELEEQRDALEAQNAELIANVAEALRAWEDSDNIDALRAAVKAAIE